MKVLLMEDDTTVRLALTRILTSGGHTVVSAADGAEGMAKLRAEGADTVITDLFMPVQDGLETITQLRTEFPELPVVAITAGTAFLSIENARDTSVILGADAFIAKPIDQQVLFDVLADVTQKGNLL